MAVNPPFSDLDFSIANGIPVVTSKIYGKPNVFIFTIINFLFLDEDAPRLSSCGYIYRS